MAEVLERCAQARGNGAVAQKKVELTCLGLGPPENSQFAIEHDPFRSLSTHVPIENGDLPSENGDLPIENGDLPSENGDLPIENGDLPCDNM